METSLILNPYFKDHTPSLEDIPKIPLLSCFGGLGSILRSYGLWFKTDRNACFDTIESLIYEDLKKANKSIVIACTYVTYWMKKVEYLLFKFPETERYYQNLNKKTLEDAKERFFGAYFVNSVEEA